jgi:hypothetical protein
MNKKTAGRTGYDAFGGIPEDWNGANDSFWTRITDAVIAHVHPQIEAKTRAECLEQVAAWAINQGFATGHADTLLDLLKELEWQIKVYECKELKK